MVLVVYSLQFDSGVALQFNEIFLDTLIVLPPIMNHLMNVDGLTISHEEISSIVLILELKITGKNMKVWMLLTHSIMRAGFVKA